MFLNDVLHVQQASTLLAELDQSPPQTTHIAMKGCSDALVSNSLLRHKDKEVGLLVAICISEIMRIVAPDAPYSDETLKVISVLLLYLSWLLLHSVCRLCVTLECSIMFHQFEMDVSQRHKLLLKIFLSFSNVRRYVWTHSSFVRLFAICFQNRTFQLGIFNSNNITFMVDHLQEIFQLIVTNFKGLDDVNSPSFARRVSILETVAKVRSCVVMLDLECDDLILEMFETFFHTARCVSSTNRTSFPVFPLSRPSSS